MYFSEFLAVSLLVIFVCLCLMSLKMLRSWSFSVEEIWFLLEFELECWELSELEFFILKLLSGSSEDKDGGSF